MYGESFNDDNLTLKHSIEIFLLVQRVLQLCQISSTSMIFISELLNIFEDQALCAHTSLLLRYFNNFSEFSLLPDTKQYPIH